MRHRRCEAIMAGWPLVLSLVLTSLPGVLAWPDKSAHAAERQGGIEGVVRNADCGLRIFQSKIANRKSKINWGE